MVTGQGRFKRVVRVWLPVGFFLVLAPSIVAAS